MVKKDAATFTVPLSCLQKKIPGLSRTPKTLFQDSAVAKQCLNTETNSSCLLYIHSVRVQSIVERSTQVAEKLFS